MSVESLQPTTVRRVDSAAEFVDPSVCKHLTKFGNAEVCRHRGPSRFGAGTQHLPVSVNGVDQGLLVGLRAPSSDYPVYDVNDPQLTCGLPATRSDRVIDVKAGDRIGAWWGHVIGGEQYPNDPDNPIAASHKGPISTYMARWFKIHEDTFDPATGRWGVDNMIAAGGWSYVDLPACLAPGQYLLRQELLALHSAYSRMGAQFYQSCAQLNVSGPGTCVPSQTVSIPGAYRQDDPGILYPDLGQRHTRQWEEALYCPRTEAHDVSGLSVTGGSPGDDMLGKIQEVWEGGGG
ncbi:hypothetical protein VTG60DRAFT_3622 [Thermothelomyces hinnuleus]